MSEHEWKPGDVAMVEAGCWANRKVALRLAEGWSHVNGVSLDADGIVTPVRRLLVIDPEDRVQVERLRDLMDEAYWAQNDGALDFPARLTGARGSALQAGLRALANPTPEPLPEPTDPAVRVVDAEDHIAARIGDEWVSAQWGPICWEQAWHERGPLRIVTPDAPTPDADRPLKVGDRVRIVSPLTGRHGDVATVLAVPGDVGDDLIKIIIEDGAKFWASPANLTRIPGGEA